MVMNGWKRLGFKRSVALARFNKLLYIFQTIARLPVLNEVLRKFPVPKFVNARNSRKWWAVEDLVLYRCVQLCSISVWNKFELLFLWRIVIRILCRKKQSGSTSRKTIIHTNLVEKCKNAAPILCFITRLHKKNYILLCSILFMCDFSVVHWGCNIVFWYSI